VPKRILTKALVGAASLSLALAIVEGMFRWLDLGVPPYSPPAIYVGSDEGGWVRSRDEDIYLREKVRYRSEEVRSQFRPNVTYKQCYDLRFVEPRPYMDPEGCVLVQTNEDNLRGPLVSTSKPSKTFRIVTVGDSFTFGHGVPFEGTWTYQLERIVDGALAACGSGWRCDSVNAGVNGYDTRDAYVYLRKKALKYRPDLVLYGFFINDVLMGPSVDDLVERRRALERYERGLFGEPGGAARHSRVIDTLVKVSVRLDYFETMVAQYSRAFRADSPHWQLCSDYVLRMKRVAEEAGAAFAVVLLPLPWKLDVYPVEDAHRFVRGWCRENGVALVDALDVLRGRRSPELWVHPTDTHFNAAAYGLVAGHVFDRLGDEILSAVERANEVGSQAAVLRR